MNHKLKGKATTRQVWLDDNELTPKKSQKIRNHSPDGFMWGYCGSGPAQLALAIMLEITGASEGYQEFKRNVISHIPLNEDFEIEFEHPVKK